jgi:hypothetical protein
MSTGKSIAVTLVVGGMLVLGPRRCTQLVARWALRTVARRTTKVVDARLSESGPVGAGADSELHGLVKSVASAYRRRGVPRFPAHRR